ncbi:hypothetical protein [Microbaculum sp. FT89]|uniref:hypothetical protein n=1 Tax=Microbaculum sp. FT89 TaxID=3447298 RepID=UPI003F53DB8A
MDDTQTFPETKPNARYLRRADAADYIQSTYGFPCSRQWLAKLAVIGGGPLYRKAGRTPLYAPADLDAWAEARIGGVVRSTSETPETGHSPV